MLPQTSKAAAQMILEKSSYPAFLAINTAPPPISRRNPWRLPRRHPELFGMHVLALPRPSGTYSCLLRYGNGRGCNSYRMRCLGIEPVLPVHSRSLSPMQAQASPFQSTSDLGRSVSRSVRLSHSLSICTCFFVAPIGPDRRRSTRARWTASCRPPCRWPHRRRSRW